MLKYTALVFFTTAAQWALLPVYKTFFEAYPHFRTPLNDVRELREMFYTYETKGEFYHNTF